MKINYCLHTAINFKVRVYIFYLYDLTIALMVSHQEIIVLFLSLER